MPRKARFFVADVPTHVVQRGNNRQAIFFADNDYRVYLGWVGEASERYGCEVHAYALMSNHVHLLVTPQDAVALSRMMQYVGRRYVPYVNHEYRRSGTLWEGRFKASLVQGQRYLFSCYRYIELNPVVVERAGGVSVVELALQRLGPREPLHQAACGVSFTWELRRRSAIRLPEFVCRTG